MPLASSALPSSGSVIDAAAITRADMTVSVSRSDVHACVARVDALISAIGLSISSPLPTSQSNPFFTTPGTPWAYSGLDMRIASHARSLARKPVTVSGVPSPSRSGLNGGRAARPCSIRTSTPCGASCTAASTSALFDDPRRRLPEIATTCTCAVLTNDANHASLRNIPEIPGSRVGLCENTGRRAPRRRSKMSRS